MYKTRALHVKHDMGTVRQTRQSIQHYWSQADNAQFHQTINLEPTIYNSGEPTKCHSTGLAMHHSIRQCNQKFAILSDKATWHCIIRSDKATYNAQFHRTTQPTMHHSIRQDKLHTMHHSIRQDNLHAMHNSIWPKQSTFYNAQFYQTMQPTMSQSIGKCIIPSDNTTYNAPFHRKMYNSISIGQHNLQTMHHSIGQHNLHTMHHSIRQFYLQHHSIGKHNSIGQRNLPLHHSIKQCNLQCSIPSDKADKVTGQCAIRSD